MDHLALVLCSTGDMPGMTWFYESAVGLPVRERAPDRVVFDTPGASLALQAMPDPSRRGVQLRFATDDLEARVRELEARGVRFDPAGIEDSPTGRLAFARDPEGNAITFWEPERRPSSGAGFALSVVINCDDVEAQRRFYAETLRFPIVVESPWWVGLDVGEAGLGLHPRTRDDAAERERREDEQSRVGHGQGGSDDERRLLELQDVQPGAERGLAELRNEWAPQGFEGALRGQAGAAHDRPGAERQHSRPITVGFAVPGLVEWHDEARERGLAFVSPPSDRGYGVFADAVDGDGNEISFRDAPEPETIEEQLAGAYEEPAAAPSRGSIRRTTHKVSKAVSRVALRPAYRTSARPARRRPSATTQAVSKVRGGGPERTRQMPKRTADEKKARAKPAVGRNTKAVIARRGEQKRTAANVSKAKPVKRASRASAAKRARSTATRGATRRLARASRPAAQRGADRGGRRR
jgi:predicted enzyme related to lactoylglutathione lyase